MEQKKIETEEDFKMAMSAVRSSIELLGMFDWQDWVKKESFFQSTGSVTNPKLLKAVKNDPQWEMKVRVFRAVADYMAVHHDIRLQLFGATPDEG